MPAVRQRYSEEFRDRAVGRMLAGAKVRELSLELKVAQSVLFEWRKQSLEGNGKLRYEGVEQRKNREIRELRAQVHGLQAKIGEQAMDLDFFRTALRRVGAKIPASGNAGNNRSARRSATGRTRKAR